MVAHAFVIFGLDYGSLFCVGLPSKPSSSLLVQNTAVHDGSVVILSHLASALGIALITSMSLSAIQSTGHYL